MIILEIVYNRVLTDKHALATISLAMISIAVVSTGQRSRSTYPSFWGVAKESGAPGVDRGDPPGNPRKQHPRSPSSSTKETKTIKTLEFFLGPI